MTTTTIIVESSSTITNTAVEVSTVVQTTETPTIIVGGIMGPPGPASNLSSSGDVDVTNLQDGSTLVWDTASNRWQATTLLEKQVINAGFF